MYRTVILLFMLLLVSEDKKMERWIFIYNIVLGNTTILPMP